MTAILGLGFGIDSAAALVVDGRVDSAAAQERFDRRKHSRAFPLDALRFCLGRAGLDPGGLERVAFFWNPGEHLRNFDPRRGMTYRDHREFLELVPSHLLGLGPDPGPAEVTEQTFRFAGGRKLTIQYVAHHLCHAAAAFYPSGYDEAAILTVDGYGESTSLLMARGRDTRLECLGQVSFPNSLGAVYAAVTEHLGFAANCDEGKVMALAACAEPAFSREFEQLLRLTDEGRFEVDLSYFSFYRPARSRCSEKFQAAFGPARSPGAPLERRHEQLAASLQQRVEQALVHAARHLRQVSGCRRLVMAGGVALNTVANSLVLAEAGFDELWVCPPASDAGAAMGAALYAAHALDGAPRDGAEYTDFLGPEYSAAEVRAFLTSAGAAFEECPEPAREAARRLAAGEIVGWFQGRMEYGPRALGNRSILADPRQASMKDVVNARVKHREPFRPFAPACPEEAAPAYFTGAHPSPYMMRVFGFAPGWGERLPAVRHVDGTARLQTVSASQNASFHSLLLAMGEATGAPVVLNTSFNDAGEPIVRTPAEALKCFCSTGIDSLFLGPYLISKPSGALARAPGRE